MPSEFYLYVIINLNVIIELKYNVINIFSELSRVKVIDMTGPEQRVLSGYHAISGVKKPLDQWEVQKDKKFSNFDLPELLHNLNILVEIAEQVQKKHFYFL